VSDARVRLVACSRPVGAQPTPDEEHRASLLDGCRAAGGAAWALQKISFPHLFCRYLRCLLLIAFCRRYLARTRKYCDIAAARRTVEHLGKITREARANALVGLPIRDKPPQIRGCANGICAAICRCVALWMKTIEDDGATLGGPAMERARPVIGQDRRQPRIARNSEGRTVGSRELVLVVDDDPPFLTAIERLLKAHGFDVEAFGSAAAFQNRRSLRDALCLVLDMDVGKASGIELYRRHASSRPSLPTILMAGDDSEAARNAREWGCVAYLAKPFTGSSLMGAIQKVRSGRGP